MGFGSWFHRLFGGGPAVSCNLCHCSVPHSDIDKGLAVVVARRNYCKRCVEEITHRTSRRAGFILQDAGSSSSVLLG